MEIIYKKRAAVDGKKIDFVFVQDEDFRVLMLGNPGDFAKEQQEGKIAVVLVGYPSLTSVVPEGIDFPVTLLQEIYP